MRSLQSYIWNQVAVGSGGFIYARDLPNGINYHNKGFREAVVWKKLGKIFPKFPVSDDIKDAVIFETREPLKNSSGGVSHKKYSQWLLIQEMFDRGGHRKRLNNDYDKLAGFIDALLDEIEAEIKARK